jgi:two-component system LytT family response regulator
MKTIIIEDIAYEVELIKSLLNKYFPFVQIIGTTDNVEEGVELIAQNKPDFVLMDVEIMGGTSYDILNNLQQKQFPLDFEIIFLTGNRSFDYATMAFAYSALDFLTKPIDPVMFEKAVSKAIQKANPQQYSSQIALFMEMIKSVDTQTPTKLAVNKVGGVVEFINIADIIFLEADREITNFILKDELIIKASKNLGHFEHLLVNQHHFFSISNSLLINLAELKSYDHSEKIVIMSNAKQLYASRRGGQDLKNYIAQNPDLNKKSDSSLLKSLYKLFSK